MIDVRFRPISTWPGPRRPANARNGSPFRAGYPDTLNKLEYETGKLRAKNIVIEAGFGFGDIRSDGLPIAGRRPSDPGVILSFESTHGPLRLPCDYFEDWTANLRAVTLHLERLRLASLYGVGDFGEQYKGWLRLEAGAPVVETAMTAEAAARMIESRSGVSRARILADPVTYTAAFRLGAREVHPDRGGNAEHWNDLQRAKAVLDAHFGVAKNRGGA